MPSSIQGGEWRKNQAPFRECGTGPLGVDMLIVGAFPVAYCLRRRAQRAASASSERVAVDGSGVVASR